MSSTHHTLRRTLVPTTSDRIIAAGVSTTVTGLPLAGLGLLLTIPAAPLLLTTVAFSVTLYQVILSMTAAASAAGQVHQMKALPAAPSGEGNR